MTEDSKPAGKTFSISLAMVISLWVHILGLAVWQYADPVPAVPSEIPPIMLEVELPPMTEPATPPSNTDSKQEQAAAAATPPQEEKPADGTLTAGTGEATVPLPGDGVLSGGKTPDGGSENPGTAPEEDTISLESRAPDYIDYLGQIKGAVKQHWIFPPQARERRETGRLTALFTIDNSGQLLRIVVEESSSNQILDHAALEAVRGAAPFPPFPEHIRLKRLNIRARFDYRIKFIAVR